MMKKKLLAFVLLLGAMSGLYISHAQSFIGIGVDVGHRRGYGYRGHYYRPYAWDVVPSLIGGAWSEMRYEDFRREMIDALREMQRAIDETRKENANLKGRVSFLEGKMGIKGSQSSVAE